MHLASIVKHGHKSVTGFKEGFLTSPRVFFSEKFVE